MRLTSQRRESICFVIMSTIQSTTVQIYLRMFSSDGFGLVGQFCFRCIAFLHMNITLTSSFVHGTSYISSNLLQLCSGKNLCHYLCFITAATCMFSPAVLQHIPIIFTQVHLEPSSLKYAGYVDSNSLHAVRSAQFVFVKYKTSTLVPQQSVRHPTNGNLYFRGVVLSITSILCPVPLFS